MALLDVSVIWTLLRQVQGVHTVKSALYQATLEVFQSLATPTTFSLETLLNQGLVKTITQNLHSFK